MLKDKSLGKKMGLTEQRALAGTQGRKRESLRTLEEEAGHSGGLQGYREVMQQKDLKDQSPTRT